MTLLAIVDTGPLVAAADRRSILHGACAEVLLRDDLELIVPSLVVAEATYMIATRLGTVQEAVFLRSLTAGIVDCPPPAEWLRISDLVEQYADFPLGGTDASIVATAERLDVRTIVTLDRRHFSVVRPAHCAAFELLP